MLNEFHLNHIAIDIELIDRQARARFRQKQFGTERVDLRLDLAQLIRGRFAQFRRFFIRMKQKRPLAEKWCEFRERPMRLKEAEMPRIRVAFDLHFPDRSSLEIKLDVVW